MVTETTLSSAWDQHVASEFAAQSPEQALATMTAEPYVNVVPLMIGSRGRNETRDPDSQWPVHSGMWRC